MKITLYGEKNNGVIFALSDENSVDTTENGWLFPHLSGNAAYSSNEVFSASRSGEELFIELKNFGCMALEMPDADIEIEILPITDHGSYVYRNLPISGGGYVTGFAFNEDGCLFCRTDIGGCYSCESPYEVWKPLSHDTDMDTEWLCNPLALTCKNNSLYVLFGNHLGSFLGISFDKGKSFSFSPVPAFVHGNCLCRSTGERIAVTSHYVFIGTRGMGLMKSELGESPLNWENVTVSLDSGDELYVFKGHGKSHEKISACNDITFVHAANGSTIIVGAAEECGVYASYDGGRSFSQLPSQPKGESSFISQRCAALGEMLFISYSRSDADRSFMWYSYVCDGSRLCDGRIYKYIRRKGIYEFLGDITPTHGKCGFSGIDISSCGKHLVCTTVCGTPDKIFLSRDYGESWTEVLSDKSSSAQIFSTPYMKPENNNGQSVIHWMSDIKIVPNDCESAYINTGTGVFRTRNLGSAVTLWEDFSEGIEETVHLGIYSPPSGKVRVLDAVGDLEGFAFTSLEKKCSRTFSDENNNRYITVINADFAEKRPEIAVITPRGNWIGTSKGGVALSFDGGLNWRQINDPAGLSSRSDELLERISRPNTDPGWTAVSCDGTAIIRQIADLHTLPSDCTAVTFDYGETWTKICFFDGSGRDVTGEELSVRIFSDRLNPHIFYAFGNGGELFVSRDRGVNFKETAARGFLPRCDFSSIHEHKSPDIRVSPFKSGEILMFFKSCGIIRLMFSESCFISERLIPEKHCSCALCGGYGKGGVIFFCGIYDGEYGLWRSLDSGWVRINTHDTQFGQIRSICGDPRAYGRFYIATGSFGALYGEIKNKERP